MTQTHVRIPSTSVWDARAKEFELRLRDILAWARQNGAEVQGRSIDLRAAVTLPGIVATAFDRRLPVLGGGGAFDLTDMPDKLAAPLRNYVLETGGYDSALPVDHQSSDNPAKLHSFTLSTAGRRLVGRLA